MLACVVNQTDLTIGTMRFSIKNINLKNIVNVAGAEKPDRASNAMRKSEENIFQQNNVDSNVNTDACDSYALDACIYGKLNRSYNWYYEI